MKITIAGKTYPISTTDEPEYVRDIARELNSLLNKAMEQSDTISLTDAAILVALNLLDDSYKENHNLDNIRTQIKIYVDEAAAARLEAENLRSQLKDALEKLHIIETEYEFSKIKMQVDGQ